MKTKNNTFKRIAAGALATISVAAYSMPANVGVLSPSVLFASAIEAQDADNAILLSNGSGTYIEGIYEVTYDEETQKYTYEKVKTGEFAAYILTKDKRYVARTTALMNRGPVDAEKLSAAKDKDLNNEDLADGVYEYEINKLAANQNFAFDVVKANVTFAGDSFTDAEKETFVVKQNGIKIEANAGNYDVVMGYPVEVSVTPDTANAGKMLALSNIGVDPTGTITSMTKTNSVLTMTAVLTDATTISWTAYKPVLELTNDNGKVTATDVNFAHLFTDQVIGNIALRYGHYAEGSTTQFVNADEDENGNFIWNATAGDNINAEFVPLNVRVKGIDYKFAAFDAEAVGAVKLESYTPPVGDQPEKWDEVQSVTKPGKYRVTAKITPTVEGAFTTGDFFVQKEFLVVRPEVQGRMVESLMPQHHKSEDPTNANYNEWENSLAEPVEAVKDIYTVDWTGSEIKPKLKVVTQDVATGLNIELTEGTDYILYGTTIAEDEGIHTIGVTFVGAYSSLDDIEVKWQIINTNKYVEAKDDAKFTIGYRQATAASLRDYIANELEIHGGDASDLNISYYKFSDVDGTGGGEVTPAARVYENFNFNDGAAINSLEDYNTAIARYNGMAEDNPSEDAGYYFAVVYNAVDENGKPAMKSEGNFVAPVVIKFEVAKSNIKAVPNIESNDLTYGDKLDAKKLYKLIDVYTDMEGNEKTEDVALPMIENNVTIDVKNSGEKTVRFENGDDDADNIYVGAEGLLPVDSYKFTVNVANSAAIASTNYNINIEAVANVPFTVSPYDISGMKFDVVNQMMDVQDGHKVTTVNKNGIAAASDANAENGGFFTFKDFDFASGENTVANTALGKIFTVTIRGIKNFMGVNTVDWYLNGSVLSDEAVSYVAEFDAAKPRINASIDLSKVTGDGEIVECGFYYSNNGKLNGAPTGDSTTVALETKVKLLDADKDNSTFDLNSKKVTFNENAIAKASDGVLTAAIANSSVLKDVYAMPYVVYANGETVYGNVSMNNYYELVLNAEGALELTKEDYDTKKNDGTIDKNRVKISAKRVDKKGYEVISYGILYNNSSSFVDADGDFTTTLSNYDKWLNVDYKAEKTVKFGDLDASELASGKLGVTIDAINTADEGIGAKKLYAKAYVTIRDASNEHNIKTYYSNLADCTYGAYKLEDTVFDENNTADYYEENNLKKDANNKTQVEFYAKQTVEVEGANVDLWRWVKNSSGFDENAPRVDRDGKLIDPAAV